MEDGAQPRRGERQAADVAMRDSFLRTGKVPFGLAVRKGFGSLLCDPWRMLIKHLPGPIGFKWRQWYYRGKLGGMGKGVVIDPDVDIVGPANVYLDDYCYLGKRTQLVAPEGYIRIGKRCHLLSWVIGHGGVEIGDCVGAGGMILSATDSHHGGHRMAGPMIPPEQRNIRLGKVVIEDDAFIGHYSILMPGVTIGQGAIVGPHSLVVSNVKPWTVVIGSPARVIATRQPVKFPAPD